MVSADEEEQCSRHLKQQYGSFVGRAVFWFAGRICHCYGPNEGLLDCLGVDHRGADVVGDCSGGNYPEEYVLENMSRGKYPDPRPPVVFLGVNIAAPSYCWTPSPGNYCVPGNCVASERGVFSHSIDCCRPSIVTSHADR